MPKLKNVWKNEERLLTAFFQNGPTVQRIHASIFGDFKVVYDTVERSYGTAMANNTRERFSAQTGEVDQSYLGASNVRVTCVCSKRAEGFGKGMNYSVCYSTSLLKGVIRRAGIEPRGTIFSKNSQPLAFTDDLDIITRNLGKAEAIYARLKAEAKRIELQINASKTKYMVGRSFKENNVCLPRTVTIDGNELEVVDEFVYLRSDL